MVSRAGVQHRIVCDSKDEVGGRTTAEVEGYTLTLPLFLFSIIRMKDERRSLYSDRCFGEEDSG